MVHVCFPYEMLTSNLFRAKLMSCHGPLCQDVVPAMVEDEDEAISLDRKMSGVSAPYREASMLAPHRYFKYFSFLLRCSLSMKRTSPEQ